MAPRNLSSMSVDALLKLRTDLEQVLSRKAAQLRKELSKLSGKTVSGGFEGGGSPLKGKKVAVKYRDKAGNTWAGRGVQPKWLRAKLKAGAKLEDFAVTAKRRAKR
jgi:DNA-binding protein H-NS